MSGSYISNVYNIMGPCITNYNITACRMDNCRVQLINNYSRYGCENGLIIVLCFPAKVSADPNSLFEIHNFYIMSELDVH